jgi:Zn-dependent protease with chaperone function/Zn-finger nucleic acid-binding protein
MPNGRPDFYEIQSSQRAKTLALFAVLLLFYVVAVGLVALALLLSVGLFIARGPAPSGPFFFKLGAGVLAGALLIAVLHFRDARRSGAAFILKRLEAAPPETGDLYHARFADAVDEIRIAAGLPRIRAYILPVFAVNSLALIEADGTPAVVATEGLLAEFSRDELQAVVAHELAHVVRGDAFYLTLVCSLANLFERFRESLESAGDDDGPAGSGRSERGVGPPVLLYLVVLVSSLVMKLLSTLISRERETLADAAAVELGRDPDALARAIYKAHVKNSFLGDFSASYGPLFLVGPQLEGEAEGFWRRLFATHPPVMKRVRLLAAMAHKSGADIIHEVHEEVGERESARTVLHAAGEGSGDAREQDGALAPDDRPGDSRDRIWLLWTPRGVWEGPFSLEELLFRPHFTPLVRIKNASEGIEARAREFPAVREALQNLNRRRPIRADRAGLCPRCRLPLGDAFYEGVAVKACPGCGGKLVDAGAMDRILARREVGFDPVLVERARAFQTRFLENPAAVRKIGASPGRPDFLCPACGYRMAPRPYNYQYYIPVDKCLSCQKIWFDADELEILQILVERKGRF